VGAAEDVHGAIGGPKAEVDEQNDALDDAPDVCLSYPQLPQWAGAVLGHL